MCREAEGTPPGRLPGLKRLAANHFRFTESPRAIANREVLRQDANNVILFMESTGYIALRPATRRISVKELYKIYCIWCEENSFSALKPRSFSDFLVDNQQRYHIAHNNNQLNAAGRPGMGLSRHRAAVEAPHADLRRLAEGLFPREPLYRKRRFQ